MPFNFLRKKAPVEEPPAPVDPTTEVIESARKTGGVAFDGLTEEWRLVGVMHIDGRLSDALNRREAIAIADVSWAPADGSEPFTPVPGLKSVDPYDLIVVLAGEGTLPPLSEAERVAHKIHKVPVRLRPGGAAVPDHRDGSTCSPAPNRSGSSTGARRCSCRSWMRRATWATSGWARRGRGGPGQPLLPAGHRAGRQAQRRAGRAAAATDAPEPLAEE